MRIQMRDISGNQNICGFKCEILVVIKTYADSNARY